MIEIYFQESLDAAKVYELFCLQQQIQNINYIELKFDQENIISIIMKKHNKAVIKTLVIPVLTGFIIQTKEDHWMLSMLEDIFYFSDHEEKHQILEIAHSIVEGEREEIPTTTDLAPREKLIMKALQEFLVVPISFSFESFLKFRLRKYTERLLHYVEVSIDEYKLEQEYQNFIQTLRDFTSERMAKMEHVNILHGDQLTIYNEHFTELRKNELMKFVDRKLFQNHPMHIDSSIIAPLVSIAPEVIHLYTNQVDHGIVQTIRNIFQERVQIFSKKEFQIAQHIRLHKKI
ncbi:putative sporulation protein YtxC [Cytobacillus sp. S13-E01]|uniref:putative sporulation protein YtxC n=1 Tax=Cytobacillus sp. S13-E01 TaxID=3031326 RepID=UPI0023D82D85|nr:putative sporulation protein YtxC [Cytobacillus sp. S13-E01]MDF0727487.1 putative sporulation protein YtxC [Cytobacillus sp. S13-E01]